MNIEEIKKYAALHANDFVPQPKVAGPEEKSRQELEEEKKFLESELVRMRKRRYAGMDDDRAEDIVEDLYRRLKEVEKQLESF